LDGTSFEIFRGVQKNLKLRLSRYLQSTTMVQLVQHNASSLAHLRNCWIWHRRLDFLAAVHAFKKE
jgi:hypothetical protein